MFTFYRKATMTQEALQTQIDKLQWEVNHLDSENKNLRDSSPRFVDLENELSLAQEDITNLNAELSLQRQQLSEHDVHIAENELKLTESTHKIEELTTALEELNEIKSRLETAEQQCMETEAKLVAAREEMNSRVSHLSKTYDIMQCEKQQLMQERELRCYRAIQEEHNKWEAREARLVKEISELKNA